MQFSYNCLSNHCKRLGKHFFFYPIDITKSKNYLLSILICSLTYLVICKYNILHSILFLICLSWIFNIFLRKTVPEQIKMLLVTVNPYTYHYAKKILDIIFIWKFSKEIIFDCLRKGFTRMFQLYFRIAFHHWVCKLYLLLQKPCVLLKWVEQSHLRRQEKVVLKVDFSWTLVYRYVWIGIDIYKTLILIFVYLYLFLIC